MQTTTVLMSLFWREREEYLDIAFESLYKQTVQPTEIILVTEGELPVALNVIVEKWVNVFSSSVLKIIPALTAKGLPACLNIGLKEAKGNYIIRFDTDDFCKEDRIEKQLLFFQQNPSIVLISSVMEEYDATLTKLLTIRKVPLMHNDILKYAKWRNPFNHPSVAYKKDIALKLNGYPEVGSNEDYAFFCNFLVSGYQTANLNEVIVKARTGKEFANRRRGKKYLQGEIECLKYIRSIGFYNIYEYYFHFISKKVVRSLPTFIVKSIYKKLLR